MGSILSEQKITIKRNTIQRRFQLAITQYSPPPPKKKKIEDFVTSY